MSNTPTNTDDVIDSRDVISRLEELKDELTDIFNELIEAKSLAEATNFEHWIKVAAVDNRHENYDDACEYVDLRDLADEAEVYGDWYYGATLIRWSYFEEYAQELAEEIGAIYRDAAWPANCIDWEEAARELKCDYTEVDFGGIEYWMRS